MVQLLLHQATGQHYQAIRVNALFASIGLVNLPIIHYSVVWWHSLHQPSTLLGWHKPAIVLSMLWPLLLTLLGFMLLAAWLVLQSSRVAIQRHYLGSLAHD